MSLSTKVSGTWKDVASVHVKVDGVWKPVANGWTKVSGVWKLVYSALQASLTDATVSGSNTVVPPTPANAFCSFYLNVSGTGPYTYQWYVTGAYSSTSALTNDYLDIYLTDNAAAFATGTAWCEVTDSYGNMVSTDVGTWDLTLNE